MSVHQSTRRHSARLQNAYEDGTDEDEPHLLQPADRYDRRRSDSGRPSSPQDQDPRHIQPHASVRKFTDRHYAATDVSSGPDPDASLPTYLVGEHLSGTEHADPTYLVGDAALPLSQHHSIPSAPHRPLTPSVQRSSDPDNARPPPPAGYYYSDSPYPQPTTHEARKHSTPLATNCHATRATQEPLEPLAALPTSTAAYGLGGHASFAAKQSADAACRAEHQFHPQQQLTAPGGGRGLSSSTSEPAESYADLEQKSAFYRNGTYQRTTSKAPPPLVQKEIPIPKFSGDIRTYPVFRNRFLETVGGRSDLEPYLKFLHLLTHLDGEPLRQAKSYLTTDINYFKLLDRLEDRYGDKAILALVLINEFINLTPVQQTVKDLRRFHDEALRLSDEMQQIGENVDDTLWRQTLLSKMPLPLRTKISEKLGKDPRTAPVHEILARISDYVRILERSELSLTVIDPARNTERSGPQLRTYRSIAVDTSDLTDLPCREGPGLTANGHAIEKSRVPTAVATTRAEEQPRERRTCPLCGLLHSAADCTVYDTTKKRLRQHNRALCKDVANDNHRKGSRPSPVRATKGSSFDPEASDHQRHSRTSAPATTSLRVAEQSVNRDVTCFMATATTLRQSGTQSSRRGNSGNLMDRKKRTKDPGTDPLGRPGTNRPPTTSTDESLKQNGADAYGRDRRLPERDHLLQTDRGSTNREMMQFDRTTVASGGGSGGRTTHRRMRRVPDETSPRELHNDEDIPHKPFDGHRTDAFLEWSPCVPDENRFQPYEESTVYVACASDSEQPAVLHECLSVTALNPASKKSCRAIIMFDSGSSSSHVSSKLARLLNLPHGEMRVQSVNTFGSKTPMAVNGFRTFLALCSSHGRRLQVHVTVSDCIVPSVRTALVRDADLPALRRNDCTPTPTREMPDLLIGQDLVHLFDRYLEPTLPNGFYIVQTSMGPTIGGAYRSVTPPGRLHLRPPELSACQPAYLAGSIADSSAQRPAYLPAYLAGGTAACDTNECLEPSTATSSASGQSSPLPRVSGILPRSPQKQLSTNPLDAQPLLLPTYSTTYVEVEVVSAAYLAVGLPRPIQEPLSSTEAELRCSIPPPPTQGNLICASLYDAGSPLQRKTRLARPQPVTAVVLLLQSDSSSIRLLRAERELQLGLMSPTPLQIITDLPKNIIQCSYALQHHAILHRDAETAVLTLPDAAQDLAAHIRAAVLQSKCDHRLSNLTQSPSATSLGQSVTGPAYLAGPATTAPTVLGDEDGEQDCFFYPLHKTNVRAVVAFPALLLVHHDFEEAIQMLLLYSEPRPFSAAAWLRTFGRSGSRHDSLRGLRYPAGLPTHARETRGETSVDSAHQQSPALDAHDADSSSGQQSTPQPERPPPPCRTRPLPRSAPSRVRVTPHQPQPGQADADKTTHCLLLGSLASAAAAPLSRVLAPQVPVAYVPPGSCLTSSCLAHSRSSMGRRKPKTTCSPPAHDENSKLALVTTNRTFHGTPGCRETVTARQHAEDLAATAKPSVLPTYLVGASGDARRHFTTKRGDHVANSRTSPTTRRPTNPRKEKRSSPAATPTHAKTSATRKPARLREQNAHAQASPTNLPCRSASLSWDMTGNSRASDLPCRYSRARNSGSTPAPPLDASNTRRADHQPRTNSSRNVPLTDQPAAATDTVHISVPPRAPRADRIDQKILAARRGSVDAEVASKLFSATPYHATLHKNLWSLWQLHHRHNALSADNSTCPTSATSTPATPGIQLSHRGNVVQVQLQWIHHRALCRNDVSNHSRATTKSTDTRAVGKKRVNIARVHVNNRNACPPKNDTICFCDGSTFHQFGRQLRSGVRMVDTPLYTRADATNFVCSFHPATEVQRVIFWFSSDSASPSHVELVRFVTELSLYYTTHYETIVQYVVVSPSVSSRQDAWTYGIFKYLVQAEVLLLDARLTMLPQDLHVRDANDHQAVDVELPSPSCHLRTGRLLNSTEDVKYFLREQYQLNLWSYYLVDHQRKPTPATPAALRAPAEAGTIVLQDDIDAPPAEVAAYLAVSEAARVYQPTSIVANNRHSPRAARPPPPADYVSAPTMVLEHLDVPTTRDAFTGLTNIADRQRDEPKAPTLSSTLGRSTRRPADQDFDEPGLVKDATYLVVSETPAAPSQTEAVTYLGTAEVQAPPPTSTNIVEQNPRVLDITAATDAGTALELSATPDAATPSITDAPTIAASAASFHRQRGPSDRRRRHRDRGPAPKAHGLDDRTEYLVAIAEQGP